MVIGETTSSPNFLNKRNIKEGAFSFRLREVLFIRLSPGFKLHPEWKETLDIQNEP